MPATALAPLAAAIRAGETLLSGHLREPDGDAALGALAAAGPRAVGAEDDYAFVVEAVREGYLLHYGSRHGSPRLFGALEDGLALLAGDHLYALGLERLAGLGDLDAVRELADLISLCSLAHASGPADPGLAGALWLASAVAVASGSSPAHEAAKAAMREGDDMAPAALAAAASGRAAEAGISAALGEAANSIDFAHSQIPHRG